MILLCLTAAVLAVLLAIPFPPARSLSARLTQAERRRVAGERRWWPGLAVLASLALLSAATALCAVVAGTSGAVVGASAGVAMITAGRLLVFRRRRRQAARRRQDVARGCAAIASQVRVGRIPAEALAAAAADWSVLAGAHQAQLLGGDVPETLVAQAHQPGSAGLADLARAWQLAGDTGAPMAAVLDQVALSLRRDEALQRTVAAELAGPRATGKVMAVLPLGGIGMGYLLGGRPIQFLLEGPLGWACLLGGVLLACGGVVWVDQLARVAEEA